MLRIESPLSVKHPCSISIPGSSSACGSLLAATRKAFFTTLFLFHALQKCFPSSGASAFIGIVGMLPGRSNRGGSRIL